MRSKTKQASLVAYLLPIALAALLAGGLVWYNAAHAPVCPPAELVLASTPVLNPYPELEGVQIPINTADATMLEQLPGIGPVRAAEIVAYIREHGPITSLDQLTEIKGIGAETIKKISPYLVIE